MKIELRDNEEEERINDVSMRGNRRTRLVKSLEIDSWFSLSCMICEICTYINPVNYILYLFELLVPRLSVLCHLNVNFGKLSYVKKKKRNL